MGLNNLSPIMIATIGFRSDHLQKNVILRPISFHRIVKPPIQREINARRKKDMLTGRSRNKANNVTFSNKKWRTWQEVNSQSKKVYWPAGQRFVKLRISTKTIKTIDKVGLTNLAKNAKINLWKLPFKDARPSRLEFLTTNISQVPRPKRQRSKIKNTERIAASKKKPMIPRYIGGRIFWIRDGEEKDIYEMIKTRMNADLMNKQTSPISHDESENSTL